MRFVRVLLLSFLALTASAQRLDETIEVSIVNVDVHVTDKQGNRITGLRPDDFEVRDDGKLQTITNFSEYARATSAGTAGVEVAPEQVQAPLVPGPRPRRTVVLFIEPVTLPKQRSTQLFDAIRAVLHKTVSKGDQVSVVSFTRAMHLRQPFTDDLSVIDKELDKFEIEMSGGHGTVFEESRRMLDEIEEFESEYEAALAGMGLGLPGDDEVFNAGLGAAQRQMFLIKQKAAALESLIHTISGVEGKKIVIMATRRFGLYAGMEYFHGTVPTEYRQSLDTSAIRDALIRTANAQGVTIYAVHPEGLSGTLEFDASREGKVRTYSEDLTSTAYENNVLLNETAALQEVAEATGGLAAWGAADIAKILPRVTEDLESYYSIGYRTPVTRKDAARKIVVTTKNRNYIVRARQQFVEKSEVTQMNDRVVANLFQKVSGSTIGIPFDVAVGQIRKKGKNRWVVPLNVRVPIRALTTLPGDRESSGEFSVYVATGGLLGVMSEPDRRSQTFRIPNNQLQRAQGSHFTYEFELAIDQQANRLSVGVIDEVGKEFGLKRYMLPKR